MNATQEMTVGRKKTTGDKPRRYGTQIRVSDPFAEIIVKAANGTGMSVADFADRYMMAIAEKHYRDAIMREAERLKGGEPARGSLPGQTSFIEPGKGRKGGSK